MSAEFDGKSASLIKQFKFLTKIETFSTFRHILEQVYISENWKCDGN